MMFLQAEEVAEEAVEVEDLLLYPDLLEVVAGMRSKMEEEVVEVEEALVLVSVPVTVPVRV